MARTPGQGAGIVPQDGAAGGVDRQIATEPARADRAALGAARRPGALGCEALGCEALAETAFSRSPCMGHARDTAPVG